MKPLLLLTVGAVLLASCSAANSGGERPPLESGIEVRFPAAPTGAYLSLLTEGGESVYQVPVEAGKTSVSVDGTKWTAQSANAQPLPNFRPADAGPAGVSADGIKANFLHWVMWQDRNSDGKMNEGEALDLMTHDRVVYVSQNAEMKFSTPDTVQVWKFTQGWSRAEHYVYLPKGGSTYQRSLTSSGLQRYELHVPTPVTSQ